PPRPEQLIQAVLDIQDKIKRTGTLTGREFAKRDTFEGPRLAADQITPGGTVVAPGDFTTATRLQDDRP
ncbi:MAG: NADH-quinone oxidoreductase subunit B, partial [Gemmataceae bacterium]|nr:NADH-quinone oxidoreductase subunit B [Gemmataceae bacterium]